MTVSFSDKASIVRQYISSKQRNGIPTVKIAVLGSANVGKTSILQRFCYGDLIEEESRGNTSRTEHEWHKYVAVQGCDVHVQFDLMSDELSHMAEVDLLDYIRNNEAYMLVYDVMDEASFAAVDQIFRLYARIPRQRRWRVPFFIVASKIDRWRSGWAVPFLRGDAFAKSVGAAFLPMSALNGEGTGDEVLVDMVSRVLLSRYQNEVDTLPRAETRVAIPAAIEPESEAESISPPASPPHVKAGSTHHSLRSWSIKMLHRSGRKLEWARPKQKIHHWDALPPKYPERHDSTVSIDQTRQRPKTAHA